MPTSTRRLLALMAAAAFAVSALGVATAMTDSPAWFAALAVAGAALLFFGIAALATTYTED